MHRRILLFILFGFSVGPILAQQRLSVTPNGIGSSQPGANNYYYASRNEPPRAIEFKERKVTTTYFLSNINQYFDIPVQFTFIEAESNTDHLGMKHRLLQQYYKGIPLEGMAYRIHEKDGYMRSANGKAVRDVNVDTHISISEEQAFYLAVKYLQTKDTVLRQARKLIVSKDFTFTSESFSIAFQFDIDVSLIERWRISIDAHSGQLINKISLVNSCFKEKEMPLPYDTGTGLTNYYGTKTIKVEKFDNGSSQLLGQTENGGTIVTYDAGNVPVRYLMIILAFGGSFPVVNSSDNTYTGEYYKPAVSVQWATEKAYEYYFKKHNRYSFDNNNSAIKSFVHVDEGMNNAFWTGGALAFGDGSNNNPFVELDVVSHELTHGVTQYEAGLQYYNESGALSESFSDILGKAVEFSEFGDTATWQIAKHFRNGGLRDFSNPNLQSQPDTYFGDLWITTGEDYGGVHFNSGVQNFWFYLLCEGGSGVNDHQVNYSVKSIGMDTAVNIAYRNLTEYLSSTSDYLDSRIGSLLATADLYGENSTVYQEVDKAWDAVGVIDEPIITSLNLYDITATTVKIKGSLQPRGDTVTYHFEYGTTMAYGSTSLIYKYSDKIEGILTGLLSKTKYYLRLVATNENGSSYTATDFTTISLAPLVKIKQSIDVTETTATLYGQVNPNSLLTSFYFEYGTTPSLGLTTPAYPLNDTTEFVDVSVLITNLQPRQTYYYRLVATNGFALSITGSESFFTAAKPTISSYTPLTAPIGTEITITGQNFNTSAEMNLVRFGATRATVLSASKTEVKVKVPIGASLGPISLLDAQSGLMDESIQVFVPTFTGEFKKGNLQLRASVNDLYVYQSVVEDMDGDGKADIVASHYLGFTVFQNVNQGGDITNESFIRSTYTADISEKISVADFDGNGLKDIVVGRYGAGFRIYPNFSVPGYIFFGVPVDVPSGYLTDMVLGDFDKDGRIDIAGISSLSVIDSVMVKVFRNKNPKGVLSANNFEKRNVMALPYYAYGLRSDDLNNDGYLDLMLAISNHSFIPVLKNNPAGNFGFEEVMIQDSTLSSYPLYISQDMNQDGRKDIISYLVNVSVLENENNSPDITMAKPIRISDISGYAVQPGDINGDGKVDLAVGTDDGGFIFLKNKTEVGEHLSNSSFEMFEHYNSLATGNTTNININDLNGDGRPEVISRNNSGYVMEVWQNSPISCPLDPSLVSINVSSPIVTIVLPANTTLDQFQIEYSPASPTVWSQISSTTLYLSPGYSYQLRIRSKCFLGYSSYYFINFTIDCVDLNSFSVFDIGIDRVSLSASNLSSFEIQYSSAGKNQWQIQPWYSSYISNLLPGTTYDLRFRGQCNATAEFHYKQFTTLCPQLSALMVTDITYNKALVSWSSYLNGDAVIEYSADNISWNLIDETKTMFPLVPGVQYLVKGSMKCTDINSDFIYTSFITPCPKVSMLDVINVTPFSARINWVDESNTQSYTLTYWIATSGTVTTVETSSNSFNLEGLSPGTQYTVSVAPQCIGTKDFTSTIFSTVCYVPFNLTANNITHTAAELSWSDNFTGLPYWIDYSISGSNIWLTTETELTIVWLAGLRPGTEYEARVHINCLSETAPYVSVNFATNLYEETTLSPNPTTSVVTISPSKDLIGNHFSILDSTGKEIASGVLLDYGFDLSVFLPGIYILRIDGENSMKIVKY